MVEYTNVVIGIQARTTSERFPSKVLEKIGEHTMLEHVITAAQVSARYVNFASHKTNIKVDVALLIPEGDERLRVFRKGLILVEGSEKNVLSRYKKLQVMTEADYIVRLTADCPLMQPHIITKHIRTAAEYQMDYLSNVDEECRTFPDGLDCEVFSDQFLDYLVDHAKDPKDLEHVTTLGRREPPSWAKMGQIIGHLDLSDLKISVDTPEDLERVRQAYGKVRTSLSKAERLHGRANVFRL